MNYRVTHVFLSGQELISVLYTSLLCLKYSCWNINAAGMTWPLTCSVFVQTGFVFSATSEHVVGF